MEAKPTIFHSLWYTLIMSVISLGMTIEYTRLVFSGYQTTGKIIASLVWIIMAITWVSLFIHNLRSRRG